MLAGCYSIGGFTTKRYRRESLSEQMPPDPSKRIALFLLILLSVSTWFLSQRVHALNSRRELSQFAHQAWSTENGLPQNTVHAIVQGADGYIWLATEEGLARFDGITFTVFEKDNTPHLKSSDIRALAQDSKGSLRIGTTDGLVQLLAGKFTTFTTQEGLPGNNIQSLMLDHKGSLWVATTSGLAQYHDGAFSSFVTQPALPTNSVQAVFEDRDNTIWIGT